MIRILTLICIVVFTKNAISFEMDLNGNQENIVFVKKKKVKSNNVKQKKKTIVINKNTNNNSNKIIKPVMAEKQAGKVVNVNQIDRNKNIYASTDDIVVPKVNINSNIKTTKTSVSDKNSKVIKKTNNVKPKVSVLASNKKSVNTSKDLIFTNKNKTQTKSVKKDVVDRLCEMATKNDVVNFKKTLMNVKYADEYVNATCGNGNTLLMISVINDNYLTCKLLVENNANVNILNDAKVSVLHTIVQHDSSNFERMFKLLINSKNVNLNLQDIEGYTPAMRALLFNKIPCVKTLLSAGADIDIKNNYGEDILDLSNKQLKVADRSEKQELVELINILQKAKNNF